ncbi:hypothetical protein [Streptomyces sp. NRRL S-515]|uniref:hypothetical protein n=1 Tax=Streptomyces sp. NRRL S-515 TaxID=1463913 RepID=UPI002D21CE43|nr:hypothetical protein [Streptomyces sp. NRRL S-515]
MGRRLRPGDRLDLDGGLLRLCGDGLGLGLDLDLGGDGLGFGGDGLGFGGDGLGFDLGRLRVGGDLGLVRLGGDRLGLDRRPVRPPPRR